MDDENDELDYGMSIRAAVVEEHGGGDNVVRGTSVQARRIPSLAGGPTTLLPVEDIDVASIEIGFCILKQTDRASQRLPPPPCQARLQQWYPPCIRRTPNVTVLPVFVLTVWRIVASVAPKIVRPSAGIGLLKVSTCSGHGRGG
eukprot:CAMPEP_0114422620 /NCGR_PEP_ID=MMETSP0103-20121206/5705_1 /TAXON_ID=37642 ORGANISM="Paraphysomonas imperforata, Strain PA2" /NCGR_SAMPLE_ID=MMETSP0103 /ASSEMBLY_ACC=CAM_ASM_000201 /LENGTH=143 /DNA_ID=CAMNT_0001591213 /DNA_START=207 /DNA_END=639 /DNA_ORIENTATION=+